MNTILEPRPGKWKRVLLLLILAILFILAIASALWTTPASATAWEALAQDTRPVKGWVNCKDLGIGRVPGLSDARQRFKLCHPGGWEVKTFCTIPNYPAPGMGTTCTRSGDIYICGSGVQQLRQYAAIATPAAPTVTQTPVATPIPGPTASTPTSTPVYRPRPGGPGNSVDIAIFLILEAAVIVLVGACAILLVNKLRGKP